jgi:predicted FMN-binding regulatory protein PaiB
MCALRSRLYSLDSDSAASRLTVPALVTFRGPDAYVSPGYYPSKKEHGKVVPTWNYVAVHVTGKARLFEDTVSLLRHLNELTDSHESGFADFLDRSREVFIAIRRAFHLHEPDGKFVSHEN